VNMTRLLCASTGEKCLFLPSTLEKISELRGAGVGEAVFYGVEPPDPWRETLGQASMTTRVMPSEGNDAVHILGAAKEAEASMVVILEEESLRERDAFPGPVLKDLVQDSPVPILVILENSGDKTAKGLFSHVIYGTNWTEPAERALDLLLRLRDFIVEMEVIHVINEKLTVRDMRQIKEKLTGTRRRCLDQGIDAEAHYYAGDTAEEIVVSSRDYRGSVIVVGGITEKPLVIRLLQEEPVFGVLKRSPVPVLIVP